MSRTHDVTISAFDLDRLEAQLDGAISELSDAKVTAEFWIGQAEKAEQAAADLKAELEDTRQHWKEELTAERALADRLAEVLDYYYSEDSRHHIASNRAYARAAWSALAAWKEARDE